MIVRRVLRGPLPGVDDDRGCSDNLDILRAHVWLKESACTLRVVSQEKCMALTLTHACAESKGLLQSGMS